MLQRIAAPTQEPVSLAVFKRHLRQGAPTDDLTPAISIPLGAYAIGVHNGTAITVTNKQPVFLLHAGTCGDGGSVAVKLQHRDGAAAAWADVTEDTFTLVTEANDNAIQELAYTGIKSSVRPVATVAGAACEFAVTALLFDPATDEDDLLKRYLKAAWEFCENAQDRSYCEQTWEQIMDAWPNDNGDIILERGPWKVISSIKWKSTDGKETPLTVDTDYVYSLPRGRIRPAYGKYWPTGTLYPIDGVAIRFIVGMETVPQTTISAILIVAAWIAENRGEDPRGMEKKTLEAVMNLLGADSWGVPNL